jgi:hypothetical protein
MLKKSRLKTKKIIFTILLAAGFSLYSIRCSAQTAQTGPVQGMNISPPLLEITLPPEAESEQTIRVTNATENLLELYPSVMNFEAKGDGGEPNFSPPSSEWRKYTLADWLEPQQSKIALTPRQEISFKYKIKVPYDAAPGGHYGVVLLGTQPPETDKSSSQVAIAGQVGSLVLVRVPGDIVEEGSLEEFSAPWFFFKPPVPFTAFVKNTGNTHFKPDGEITIRNWRGKELERVPLNPQKGNILPESRRRFNVAWDSQVKPFWKIPIGRFSADLKVAYGLSEKSLGSKIYFWIVPWWIIIAAAVVLAAILIFIIFRKRRRKKGGGNRNGDFPPASDNAHPNFSGNNLSGNLNPRNNPPKNRGRKMI